ncbi:PcfJ domain-containing protein [Paenibacillus elgii]|uniref:PcfJ domain-containing protein n=1 Tax=Paenibacillus elgii TaxID=189691 RepID=UPI000248D21E|nr:PcfJ domain-containing protein [Paenibacillus elgii]
MINYLAYIKKLEDEFGLDKVSEFIDNEFGFLYNKYAHRSALRVAENYKLPVNKFLRYIYFECDVSQGLSSSVAIQQYDDYIRMATEMEYERFDRYPKFLKTIHDIVSRNYKIKLDEIELKQWRLVCEENKKFEYTYNDYKIFPPSEPDELIKEGNILGHCVGSYVNKVRKRLSTILFLREKEDIEKPLVTIEVIGNRITQVQGKMRLPIDNQEKNAIKKFAERFQLSLVVSI